MACGYPRFYVVTVQKYLDVRASSALSRAIAYAVADSELANRCVSRKFETRDLAQREADIMNEGAK